MGWCEIWGKEGIELAGWVGLDVVDGEMELEILFEGRGFAVGRVGRVGWGCSLHLNELSLVST